MDDFIEPNEKAQVRPPKLGETKRSWANWHGSKASPAAIWLGVLRSIGHRHAPHGLPLTINDNPINALIEEVANGNCKLAVARAKVKAELRKHDSAEARQLIERQSHGAVWLRGYLDALARN